MATEYLDIYSCQSPKNSLNSSLEIREIWHFFVKSRSWEIGDALGMCLNWVLLASLMGEVEMVLNFLIAEA